MSLRFSMRHRLGSLDLDVAFEAPPGITVLYGASGAGKTTVVNAVAGLIRADAARVEAGGTVLQDSAAGLWLPPHKRRLGYVFQEARLFPHLTVRQNLHYGRWFSDAGKDEAEVVELLGIGALLGRRPGGLSGGEKQRVALGRALLAGPRMLLADEPLAALDEARRAEILPYFERLRDEAGMPMLYVSHSAAEVARLATTVVVLKAGRVVTHGPAAQVLSDPEVTPLGPRAAGAVIEVKVAGHEADRLSRLTAEGMQLLVPKVERAVGEVLRVRIEAQDVMLALTRPEGISALNIWAVTVVEIRIGEGPGALVQLEAGRNRMLARVTRRSVEALGLRRGLELFAVVKAVSVAKG